MKYIERELCFAPFSGLNVKLDANSIYIYIYNYVALSYENACSLSVYIHMRVCNLYVRVL